MPCSECFLLINYSLKLFSNGKLNKSNGLFKLPDDPIPEKKFYHPKTNQAREFSRPDLKLVTKYFKNRVLNLRTGTFSQYFSNSSLSEAPFEFKLISTPPELPDFLETCFAVGLTDN